MGTKRFVAKVPLGPRLESRGGDQGGIPPHVTSVLEVPERRGPGPRSHAARLLPRKKWSFAVHFVGTRKGHGRFFYDFQKIFEMLLLIYQLIVDRHYGFRIFNTSIICP